MVHPEVPPWVIWPKLLPITDS